MTNINIKALKAKVKAAQKENTARVREAAEIARLEATLKLESSEELFAARVKLTANSEQTEKLQNLVNECEGIVASVPVYNQKTRTNRQWAGSHKYNYGNQIDLMYQLATGILYACAEHKQLLLAHTGLNVELLEQVVKAFGTPTYYSRNYNTIVKEKPFDVALAKSTINIMQSILGVVIDTSSLATHNFVEEFNKAKITAKKYYGQASKAINEADFEL